MRAKCTKNCWKTAIDFVTDSRWVYDGGRMMREGLVRVVVALLAAVACSGENSETDVGNVGATCVAGDEFSPTFSGFSINEIVVESGSPDCDRGLCLTNHFQGRASCPYGQTTEEASTNPRCFLPGSDSPVTVPVDAQLVQRRAELAMTCSCRCGGSGDGPNCSCPSGTRCVDVTGLGSAGSHYCIPSRSEYDPLDPPSATRCDSVREDCGEPRPY